MIAPPSSLRPVQAAVGAAAPNLSVVIPMYQERARIGATLADVLATLRAWGVDAEVLAVDDGSTDGTREVVDAMGSQGDICVRVLVHGRNKGKGAAVRTGLAAARGDWVLVMDADNATRLSEMPALAMAAKDSGAAIAIGSRACAGAKVETTPLRRVSGRAFHAALIPLGLALARDTQCGFKLYRRDAAAYMARHAIEDGFAFDVEHLLLARRAGIGVREVGVRWRHQPGGVISVARDGVKMLRAAWGIKRRLGATGAPPLGAMVEVKPLAFPAGAPGA